LDSSNKHRTPSFDFDARPYRDNRDLHDHPSHGSPVERRARAACIANVLATLLAGIVYFSPHYSIRLLLIGFPWGITAPATMLLLALALRTRLADGMA
jgi:hypothetical protein